MNLDKERKRISTTDRLFKKFQAFLREGAVNLACPPTPPKTLSYRDDLLIKTLVGAGKQFIYARITDLHLFQGVVVGTPDSSESV